MIVGVVNDSDDLFVVGDVSSGCGGTSEHGRGSVTIWLLVLSLRVYVVLDVQVTCK